MTRINTIRRLGSRCLFAAMVAVALIVGVQVVARHLVIHRSQSAAAQSIADLSEHAAAGRVRDLLPLDVEAVETIAPLLADRREAVAAAAGEVLADLLARWESLSAGQSAPRVERLAHALAAVARHVPPSRRRELHDLAARMLVWPIAPDMANSPQVLADCEAILRLPLPSEDELRIAARPAATPVAPVATAPVAVEAVPLPAAPLPVVPAIPMVESPPPSEPPPFYGQPSEPERLIDASRERAEEPRQIRPPKAIKIDG